MSERFGSGLRGLRRGAGLAQEELARRVGISRQALGALESARTIPSTAIALRLARALGCRVEDLFWLDDAGDQHAATVVAAEETPRSRRVVLAEIGGRRVAHVLAPAALALAADGLLPARRGKADATPVGALSRPEAVAENILVFGCDPALGLLAARLAERHVRPRLIHLHASSERALHHLARGETHIAGSHLLDEGSGEFNVPIVRARFAGQHILIVRLATWQEGLAVAPGNPLRLRTISDVARPGVRFVAREAGTGARRLLERMLARAHVPAGAVTVAREAGGHMQVAEAVALGVADVGIAAEFAAIARGLDFVLLAEERFDLVLPAELAEDPRVARVLETLASRPFRQELASVGDYDPSRSGELVAELRAA